MGLPDQLTVARAAAVPIVAALFVLDFRWHYYLATGVFCLAMSTDWLDGRLARSRGHTSELGTLLDPVADKLLVLTVLIVLIDSGVFPAWMVAAIVARELLVSGLLEGAGDIAEHPAVVDVPVEKGHVVLFSNNPIWRGETLGSYFLVYNAILNFDQLGAGRKVDAK
jgi:CDP-diacylglycerol--glycerol-3-phosphate 3-phosphatidyltransferase